MRRKIKVNTRLFWYLKPDTVIDLDNPTMLDMYVKQIITHGRAEDIKEMLDNIGYRRFIDSFERIKHFIPKNVKDFWEETINGYLNKFTEKNIENT
jgi:hypothetical protein